MPFDSVICRKRLDEERGNSWVCGCPFCNGKRLVIGDDEKVEMSDEDSMQNKDGYGGRER
jgi:hypothetical protein